MRENLRRERERVLARQAELQKLAAPINDAAAQLTKLDAVLDSRAATPRRKIEQLEKARDRRIAKIQQEYAAKIEAVKTEAESAGNALTPDEQAQETVLLREYTQAIVEFSKNASPAELAPLLGVSTREAKKIIEQATGDLDTPDVAASPAAPAPASAPGAGDTQPVTEAS
ncbi:hypothetical protein [Rhodococcus aetherivorans]|uniref:hypothetical protein n=1 Tax=Rhodococcus aetherivorans TaxID=191292 RepID=UPI0002D22EC1|nr:hypothetical protein [Rhodococcus aetherivorans]CCW11043.1 hypothetical protein EBESD8_15790 [Rhodococcus aetherivorans]